MNTYTYKIGDALYINLTNQCSNSCTFCIRQSGQGIDGYELWLDKEPTAQEVIEQLTNIEQYREIVFCGFGEPTIKLDEMLEICRYIRSKSNTPIRLNTNGHASLIHGKDVPPMLEGLIDTVSISLNAADAQSYADICVPIYGEKSYEALLEFARECKKYVPEVILSVVDSIGQEQLDKCQVICKELGVKYRQRALI